MPLHAAESSRYRRRGDSASHRSCHSLDLYDGLQNTGERRRPLRRSPPNSHHDVNGHVRGDHNHTETIEERPEDHTIRSIGPGGPLQDPSSLDKLFAFQYHRVSTFASCW